MTRSDRDHLNVLAICHYVLGGLMFFTAAFPAIYLVMGIAMLNGGFGPPPPQQQQQANRAPALNDDDDDDDAPAQGNARNQANARNARPAGPPPELGWLLIGIASAGIAMCWALALALISAGRCLHKRTGRTFCFVVAGFACLFQPLGLVLGIFTFLVLTRPSVREAFERNRTGGRSDEYDAYHSD